MSRLRRLWPVLAIAVLTLIPVWRCVLLGERIGAWDEVRQMSPWNDRGPAQPWDVLQADSVLEFYGWRDQVFKAWGAGRLPLWNPSELGGTPLLANSQSGGFYPPHILAGLSQIPTDGALALLAWLHLFWAGLGVFVLSRRLGGSQTGALLGGVGFALSSFMLAWTTLPSVIETVSWIPWILFAVYLLPERRAVLILAGSVAMCLLAGHLQFAAYGLLAGGIAGVARLIQYRQQWRAMLLTGFLGLFAGVLVSGPSLVPVLDFGHHSHRQNSPTEEGYDAYKSGAIPVWQLLSLPDSELLGLPTNTLSIQGIDLNGFWPALEQRGGNFAESAIAVGPVILWLAVVGLRRRALVEGVGIGAVGVGGLLLALGTPLGALLYYGVPGWSATGSPGRACVLFVLAACILAGTWSPETDTVSTKELRDRTLLFAALIVLCGGVIFRLPLTPWIPGLTADDVAAAVPHALLAGRTLGLALLVALAGVVLVRAPKAAPYAIGALALVVAFVPGFSLIRSSQKTLPDLGSTGGRLAIVNGQWDLLQTPKALLPPNTAGLAGLRELGGYDSIVDKRTRDLLADIDGEDPAPAANGNMMLIKAHFDPVKLAEAGVTEVWSLNPLPQLGPPPPPADGIYKYTLRGPGRVQMSGGSATLTHETSETVEIEATGPGLLTLRDNLREGWSARVDDALVPFSGEPWPQVQVPVGRHTVRFRYWPPGLSLGFDFLMAGLLIIALYVAGSRRVTPQFTK